MSMLFKNGIWGCLRFFLHEILNNATYSLDINLFTGSICFLKLPLLPLSAPLSSCNHAFLCGPSHPAAHHSPSCHSFLQNSSPFLIVVFIFCQAFFSSAEQQFVTHTFSRDCCAFQRWQTDTFKSSLCSCSAVLSWFCCVFLRTVRS